MSVQCAVQYHIHKQKKDMSKNLVIVESPAKAKTIAKFLGKEFTVLSSIGHIRDIPTKKDKKGTPPIDVANHFATRYEVDTGKKKLITELKKAAKSSETVWLATDEDREGEAIAWHLCEVLSLDPKTTKRIVFHEITKTAIENAIKTPRTIDMDLVNAQQARRILDRLVGFDLSPIVQRKVPGGKSAGRVQSPAVRLLVEREREIQNFQATSTYKIVGRFITESNDTLDGELSFRADSKEQARLYLEQLVTANYNVKSTSTSPSSRNPGAPYTTSTLQQDAANKLGFSVKTTMSAAQKLYQSGKITYMRTDSVNLSKEALSSLGSYIKSSWGEDYYHFRTFKTKSASAQEAHEAIRPTDPSTEVASDDSYEQKLYTLIRARTLASQMTAAKLEKTTVVIAISTKEDVFEAKGEVILFDGFLKVYNFNKKEAGLLPAVNAEDILSAQYIEAKEIFARPPARFSEASLVKKLEELGIGRPSTYATIISTIQARGYAEKGSDEGEPRDISIITLSDGAISESITKEKTGSDKGKLIPTASGGVVSDFLGNHFNQVIDYGFTAHVEEDFDKIAEGKLEWYTMLEQFYTPFSQLVAGAGEISRSEASQMREIGIDPKTNKPVYARFGRFGPMLQLGSNEDEAEKPRFAPLPKGARLETVTLDQALEMFNLPRLVGQTKEGEDIKANVGRFGPYIQVGKIFVSIKPHDPLTIDLATSLDLYTEKLAKDAAKQINEFEGGIKVLNGQYGPYITDGKKNAKIPKDIDPTTIDAETALQLLAKAPAKTTKRRFVKRKAKK